MKNDFKIHFDTLVMFRIDFGLQKYITPVAIVGTPFGKTVWVFGVLEQFFGFFEKPYNIIYFFVGNHVVDSLK